MLARSCLPFWSWYFEGEHTCCTVSEEAVIDFHILQCHVIVSKALLEFVTTCRTTEMGYLLNGGNHLILRFTEDSGYTVAQYLGDRTSSPSNNRRATSESFNHH